MKTIETPKATIVVNKILAMRKAQETTASGVFRPKIKTTYKILFLLAANTEAKISYDDEKKRDRDFVRFQQFIQDCKKGD